MPDSAWVWVVSGEERVMTEMTESVSSISGWSGRGYTYRGSFLVLIHLLIGSSGDGAAQDQRLVVAGPEYLRGAHTENNGDVVIRVISRLHILR